MASRPFSQSYAGLLDADDVGAATLNGLVDAFSTTTHDLSGDGLVAGGATCVGATSGDGHFSISNGPIEGLAQADVTGPTQDDFTTVFTLSQIINQLQTQWGGTQEGSTWTWGGGTLTYSTPNALPTNHATGVEVYTAMTAAMQARAVLSFEVWDDLIATTLNNAGTATNANITFNYGSTTSNGGTYCNFWGTGAVPAFTITAAQVWCNSTWTSHDTDADLYWGGYGTATYVHEIGHALGLSHPGTYNAGGGTITYTGNAEFAQDNRQFTIMSYFGGYNTATGSWTQDGTNSNWYYSSTPMLFDIAAIQAKYGADMTTRTGDSTYGFNVSADVTNRPMFNLATYGASDLPIFAVWDAGGTDTFDFSGYSANQNINLLAGAYSNVGGLVGNVAIAFNCTIENAVGGSGNDVISGNSSANGLTGGAGNDTIFGKEGNDVVVAGVGGDYVQGDSGNDSIYGGDGSDTLHGGDGDDAIYGDNTDTSGNGNDTIYGEAGNDTIVAGDGNDYVDGGIGSDSIYGNNGADVLAGWDNNDYINGGFGTDQLYGNAGDDSLDGGDADDLMFGGDGNDGVYGGNGNDQLLGENGNDYMLGQAGNDYLQGGAGDDTMFGGSGNDTFDGGAGNDYLVAGDTAGAADGSSDAFYFRGAWGVDTISGFGDSGADQDILYFQATTVGSFQNVYNNMNQIGANVLLAIDTNHGIWILNVTKAQLYDDIALF